MPFDDRPPVVLNDNGAYSWFSDERVIVHRGRLLAGSVRSSDRRYKYGDLPAHEIGACELAVLDLDSLDQDRPACKVISLHTPFEQDDHNAPALHVRPDGRVVAIYTRHSVERKVFWRVSESDDLLAWGPERFLETPGEDAPPCSGDNATYANPWQPAAEGGRLYNFFRCLHHQQNWMCSDDQGASWSYGGMFLCGHRGYAPYFKYAPQSEDTLHFVGTEDHPRSFDNSVYAGFVRNQTIHRSDGTIYAPLSHTAEKSGDIWNLTCVYRGDADHVAWVIDLHVDPRTNQPVCVFSTQRDGRGLGRREGGLDHRYHYARFDGTRWIEHEIAYAGTRLYPGEDDYTGLVALDPQDPRHPYLSTDAHPVTGQPLISNADNQCHHELFHGYTPDGGATWHFTALTEHSSTDHLRPIVPVWDDERIALIWMRGHYPDHRGPWTTQVVAKVLNRPDNGGFD